MKIIEGENNKFKYSLSSVGEQRSIKLKPDFLHPLNNELGPYCAYYVSLMESNLFYEAKCGVINHCRGICSNEHIITGIIPTANYHIKVVSNGYEEAILYCKSYLFIKFVTHFFC